MLPLFVAGTFSGDLHFSDRCICLIRVILRGYVDQEEWEDQKQYDTLVVPGTTAIISILYCDCNSRTLQLLILTNPLLLSDIRFV